MAIVATESGGLIPCEGGSEEMPDGRAAIRALPWVEVDEIRDAFKGLNPFRKGPASEVSLLELEKENFTDQKVKKRREIWFLGISAKRYVLYRINDLGEIEIIKPSEHGLGHLMVHPEKEKDRTGYQFGSRKSGDTSFPGMPVRILRSRTFSKCRRFLAQRCRPRTCTKPSSHSTRVDRIRTPSSLSIF